MKGVDGYGRYDDDPDLVGCPQAASDMTPCVARDGTRAQADDGRCVGCSGQPATLLAVLVRRVTEPRVSAPGPDIGTATAIDYATVHRAATDERGDDPVLMACAMVLAGRWGDPQGGGDVRVVADPRTVVQVVLNALIGATHGKGGTP